MGKYGNALLQTLFIASYLQMVVGRFVPCPSFCRFRLCHRVLLKGNILQSENRGYILGIPNSPLGSFPCIERPGGHAQELLNVTSGEALIANPSEGENFVPISKYRISEVDPPFAEDHLKWVLNPDGHSMVRRKKSRGNQDDKLERVCVQMPVSSFVTRKGTKRRTRGKSACVGFRARIPRLLIDFEWDTRDDFDLKLEEPNGFEINRFGINMDSANGGSLVIDNGQAVCEVKTNTERVTYPYTAIVENGTYIIRVDHHRACSPIPSRYKLRVMYEGKVIADERGIAPVATGENVITSTFTI